MWTMIANVATAANTQQLLQIAILNLLMMLLLLLLVVQSRMVWRMCQQRMAMRVSWLLRWWNLMLRKMLSITLLVLLLLLLMLLLLLLQLFLATLEQFHQGIRRCTGGRRDRGKVFVRICVWHMVI